MSDQQPSPLDLALTTLKQGQKAATSYERADLAERLRLTSEKLADPSLHVLVVGEFKQGKSSLVNALVGHEICPVDDDIATAVPTLARYAEEKSATAYFSPPDDRDFNEDPDADRPGPVGEPIGLDEVPYYVVERAADHERTVHSVDVSLPSRFLKDGLVLVDTPGVGGLGSTHSTITAGALPMAEAVLFISDASQEFTAPEIEFMRSARKLCPNLICVMTKIDFYPAWRKIRDLNAGHLEKLGLQTDILPVSSAMYQNAMKSGDAGLHADSGYQELTNYIRTKIASAAIDLQIRLAAYDLHAVVDQLIAPYEARRATLDDPASAAAKVAELEATASAANELKSRAARWQQTLNDGMQDVNTDVDHDLRGRFRKINQECDDALADVDPAEVWSEFEPWLYRRTAADVVANYQFLQEQAKELSLQVAEHFGLDEASADVELDVLDPSAAMGRVDTQATIESETTNIAAQAMTGLRGGYSGMLMFGAVGTMVGVALGPIGIGLGVVMGRKQIKDEKKRALTQSRSSAKQAQRKYIDEATFVTGKDSRDALRMIQRQIRDYFTTRAEEHAVSVAEMLNAVQEASRADQQNRAKQLEEAEAELKRLNGFREKVDKVGPARVTTTARVAS